MPPLPDFAWEERLAREGHVTIAGIDEAGRGPLAGPVVAAAVILPRRLSWPDLNDSKALTVATRERLFAALTGDPDVVWAVGQASVEEIAERNIRRATHLAMERALQGLSVPPDAALIDGLDLPDFPMVHHGVVGGDRACLSIAAASIVAKVTRDAIMHRLALEYPQYGFERHKGYGTKEHIACLNLHGPCPIHREAFRPVAQLTRRPAAEDPVG